MKPRAADVTLTTWLLGAGFSAFAALARCQAPGLPPGLSGEEETAWTVSSSGEG